MSALQVDLGDTPVGLLERLGDYEFRFSFDDLYLDHPEPPVLGQQFLDIVPTPLQTVGHPPLWFVHLLPPPGPLRRLICSSAGIEGDDDFVLLKVLGLDLPGAVILRSGTPRLSLEKAVSPPPLVQPGLLRSSLSGAQMKMSVREGDRGLSLRVEGLGRAWIAKLHDPTFSDLPRVELATALWARAAGLDMPAFRGGVAAEIEGLPDGVPIGDGGIFLIERFDRTPAGERVHIEDLAQVLDCVDQYTRSYEDIGAVLAAICRQDLPAFLRRLAFCVVAGNTDAHLKNWSLIYPDGRTARLSPCYDLVASVLYAPECVHDCLALPIGGSKSFEAVTRTSFDSMASLTGMDGAEVWDHFREGVERARDAWSSGRADFGFTHEERARLERHNARLQV